MRVTSGSESPLLSPSKISVKEDVVEEQGHVPQGWLGGEVTTVGATTENDEICPRFEPDVDLDVMVHERDEGEGETWVPVEPELQRHEQRRGAVSLPLLREGSHVTDHDGEPVLLLSRLGKLGVNLHPDTQLAVDGGAAWSRPPYRSPQPPRAQGALSAGNPCE